MKKIIIVNASPRANGNCSAAMDIIAANVKDAEVEVFNLREKTVNPCLACNACKPKEAVSCVQQDDMTALLGKLDTCDALVFASPIYFSAINGPAKTFVDRTYPFFNPAKPNMTLASKFGKKILILLTAGGMPRDVIQAYGEGANRFGVAGFTDAKVVAFNGEKSNDIFSVEEDVEAVKELAAWLSE